MIDAFSLQTLVDISQHPALSKVVTHLVIGLDEQRAINHHVPQFRSLTEFHRWRAADSAQKALLYGGGAVDLLSQALVNLPDLKTIDLRDFNSNTRYRDATPGEQVPPWRSYGSSRYQQWPRGSPWLVNTTSPTNFIDTVFLVVITAIGRSSTTVKNLEVILRNRQVCLQDDAFSAFGVPQNGLTNALRALDKLHLDLDHRSSPQSWLPHPLRNTIPAYDWFDPCTAYFRRFLALTPEVTWLRLNFNPQNSFRFPSSASKLIAWLGLKPDFDPPSDATWEEGNPAPVTLPLRRLDLGNLKMTAIILRGVLSKFTDLEHISMRNVRLHGLAAPADPHQHNADNNSDCLWARVIRKLHDSSPNLKQIELSNISQEISGKSDNIIFRNEDNPTECDISTNTSIIDTTMLDQLAANTWTGTRWIKSQRNGESLDEDSPSADSMDEDSMDEDVDTDGDDEEAE